MKGVGPGLMSWGCGLGWVRGKAWTEELLGYGLGLEAGLGLGVGGT